MQPTPIRPFLLLLAAVGATSLPEASADVLVEVDPGAPFTEGDLARAVDLRTPAATGDIVIRIARLGTDQLAVIVGDRSQVVTLPDRDRAASSRVVALVVTSMLDGSQVADAEEPVIAEVTPPAPVPARRTWLQAGTTISRDDNGYWIPFVNVGVARALAPNLRLVGSLGLARHAHQRLSLSGDVVDHDLPADHPRRVSLQPREHRLGARDQHDHRRQAREQPDHGSTGSVPVSVAR